MSLKPILSLFTMVATCSIPVVSQKPVWLEPDSAYAISYRISRDFPLSVEDSYKLFPTLSKERVDDYINKGYIETLMVNDTLKVHRKAPRNFALLAPELSNFRGRGSDTSMSRRKMVADIIGKSNGEGDLVNLHRVTYKFSIDVPTVDAIKGDTLEVWMPIPLVTQRQPKVEVLSASPETYVISTPHRSVHNTVYMKQLVGEKSTHFEYTGTFDVGAQYFSPEYIRKNMKDYDRNSEIYRKYTAFEAPHIVNLEKLAKEIVKDETDPLRYSELIYDYIVANYPWAGAREYSTIPCIPQYVIDTKHGDCGQVALLYISLMRSLGIPARWESGWMLHPGEENLHDWAEVYFEGVGWVPVDASFGRYTADKNPAVQKFFSTGMDQWRFVTNQGVCGEFYPAKTYLRSESVDSQMGEVECSAGNLFYPGWNQNLEIISVEPLNK